MCFLGDTMRLNNASPTAIAEELGKRLKQARLNANLTQVETAKRAGLSRKIILNAERGRVQLANFIAILAALDMIDHLNSFLPTQEISPLQLAKLKGQARQRASRSLARQTQSEENKSSW